MGNCESCASSRRKEAASYLNETVTSGSLEDLRTAITHAEANGIDALQARLRYSELARQERQSPEHVNEMMRWAMSMQDGAMLYAVIQEVAEIAPNSKELKAARVRLREFQEDVKLRLQRFAKNRDTRGLCLALDRATHMGVPSSELRWAEQQLYQLEESKTPKASDFRAAGDTGSGQD
mmetsp:Transcript_48911/g.106335  ORF Transcript_48911/g.106335 Transcript_48911/m.106335 type:complete len:179 (-) Transcript_48911:17-553(-)